jgi:hypothetical protein
LSQDVSSSRFQPCQATGGVLLRRSVPANIEGLSSAGGSGWWKWNEPPKTIGKPWKNDRKTMGKPWENGGLMGFNGDLLVTL